MDNILEILGGIVSDPNNLSIRVNPDTQPLPRIAGEGPRPPSFSTSFRWDIFQVKVCQAIEAGRSVLVNVSPSAGKTFPVIYAWSRLVKDYIVGSPIPKMLFVCATKQLANQIYMEDVRKEIVSLLTTYEDGAFTDPETGNMVIRDANGHSVPARTLFPTDLLPTSLRDINLGHRLNGSQINLLNSWLNEFIALDTGGGETTKFGSTRVTDQTIALICTYEIALNRLKHSSSQYRIIVIDEIQEYMNKPTKGIELEVDEQRARSFSEIIKITPNSTSLVLLTGSINAQVTGQLLEILKYMGKNFYPVQISENQPNRSFIKLVPSTFMRSQAQTIDICSKAINNKSTNNLMILFSVGAHAFSTKKKSIVAISNKIISSTYKRTPEGVVGGGSVSHTSQVTTDRQAGWVGSSVSSAIGNRLTDSGRPVSDLTELQDMIRGYSVINNKAFPRDPFLATCILHGFGYIMSGKARIEERQNEIKDLQSQGIYPARMEDYKVENMDTLFVQKLFKEGKIYFMLATDAVGVGANLKVRNLYLPSLTKATNIKGKDGLAFIKLDDSSLVQLLNRAGRDPREAATIYCDPDDFDLVSKFLYSDTTREIGSISIGNITDKLILSKLFFNVLGRG